MSACCVARAEAYRDALHDLPRGFNDAEQAEIDKTAHELAGDAFDSCADEMLDWLADDNALLLQSDVMIAAITLRRDPADVLRAADRLRDAYVDACWQNYLDAATERFNERSELDDDE